METDLEQFMIYLNEVKKASENTKASYLRDLKQMLVFLEQHDIKTWDKVTRTLLNSYVLYMEKEGKAASSISRSLASVKAFFHYEFYCGRIKKDPAELIKAPHVQKKTPVILTTEEINLLLGQPNGKSAKEIRDKAMLELLYATGIRVSELISLKLSDVNMSLGYINCHDEYKDRMVPFGNLAKNALEEYLNSARSTLLKGKESDRLFTNCNGCPMSRQGFWKIIKYYGEKSGIEADITPYTLRHSFAAHLLSQGANAHDIQSLLRYSSINMQSCTMRSVRAKA